MGFVRPLEQRCLEPIPGETPNAGPSAQRRGVFAPALSGRTSSGALLPEAHPGFHSERRYMRGTTESATVGVVRSQQHWSNVVLSPSRARLRTPVHQRNDGEHLHRRCSAATALGAPLPQAQPYRRLERRCRVGQWRTSVPENHMVFMRVKAVARTRRSLRGANHLPNCTEADGFTGCCGSDDAQNRRLAKVLSATGP